MRAMDEQYLCPSCGNYSCIWEETTRGFDTLFCLLCPWSQQILKNHRPVIKEPPR